MMERNKVFVVAANKIGALVPPHMAQAVADRLKIPAEAIAGAGESQILAPDGTILAKAPMLGEAAIFADNPDPAEIQRRVQALKAQHEQMLNQMVQAGMQVKLLHSGKNVEIKEVGSFNPKPYKRDKLELGETGYMGHSNG